MLAVMSPKFSLAPRVGRDLGAVAIPMPRAHRVRRVAIGRPLHIQVDDRAVVRRSLVAWRRGRCRPPRATARPKTSALRAFTVRTAVSQQLHGDLRMPVSRGDQDRRVERHRTHSAPETAHGRRRRLGHADQLLDRRDVISCHRRHQTLGFPLLPDPIRRRCARPVSRSGTGAFFRSCSLASAYRRCAVSGEAVVGADVEACPESSRYSSACSGHLNQIASMSAVWPVPSGPDHRPRHRLPRGSRTTT